MNIRISGKNKKGFTLLEMLVVMILLGLVMTMAINMLVLPTRVQAEAGFESQVQHNLRMVGQSITKIVRDASATFALPRSNHNLLTAEWNYIIPSFDISSTQSSSIVEYKWDTTTKTHIVNVIAAPLEGVSYNIIYTKTNPSYADNLIEYQIVATINGQTREIQSEVEALNSLQIIDRGNTTHPSNTLAYRTGARPTELSEVQAAVSMVLDISGSMLKDLNGQDTNKIENTRNYKLKVEAARLITSLTANANVYVSIVPFNNNANGAQIMLPARVNDLANGDLLKKIEQLNAQYNTGTNTGDGLRRAYYIMDDFNNQPANKNKKTNNFMIVLVDGVTTFYSAYKATADYSNTYDRYVTKSAVYFDGSNQISGEIKYGSSNNTTIGYYGGNGFYNWSWEKGYVDFIGKKIKEYGSGLTAGKEKINVYVIGFSNVESDRGSLGEIAYATTGKYVFYEANDSVALEKIFSSIEKDISDSLWHIGGPN